MLLLCMYVCPHDPVILFSYYRYYNVQDGKWPWASIALFILTERDMLLAILNFQTFGGYYFGQGMQYFGYNDTS